jgi:hypothetical protein
MKDLLMFFGLGIKLIMSSFITFYLLADYLSQFIDLSLDYHIQEFSQFKDAVNQIGVDFVAEALNVLPLCSFF